MPEDADLVLVLTTEADQERAEALARAVLERRLAACVALQPLTSLYHWQGELQRGAEVQLLIKTHPASLEPLRQAVVALHSYTTPEWIYWPARCSGGYGAWLAEGCCQPR
ncbi:divalent-cation tolerance protein CutA [Cyanobium sp. CH-040]|uniref:divalent-cation tolerance protein CutA n=1 Tax=Cyanobium sp. CH-040 TaxID=2823708 RepID=UPI0020CF4BCC|nr:divalent-cation tolerance protein CutA [Cyanobium sp. CH-040]MCP9928119.1 divalent-cation tolerance protein CutA [Cyanobium sp. CH-040]